MAANVDDIVKINRLINCIDAGKDAMSPLTKEHNEFMKMVIKALFNMDKLDSKEKALVSGVGNRKKYLIEKIGRRYNLGKESYQEIHRIKFDANGNDNRFDGFYAAQDSGLPPDKLFDNYTLLVTPASILDPADRKIDHDPMINGLSSASVIEEAMLKELDIDHILKRIEYNGSNRAEYKFTFVFASEDPQSYMLTRSRSTTHPYFKGNPVKNRFIYMNYKNPARFSEIMKYVLMKELGDTLQVVWLKKMREDSRLTKGNTVLCTSDKVAWLRCLINDTSCVLTDGSLGKWYPVDESEGEALKKQESMNTKLRKNLEKTNKQVINDLFDLYNTVSGEYEYLGRPLTLANVLALKFILHSVLYKVVIVAGEINTMLETLRERPLEYKVTCVNHTFSFPFYIDKRNETIQPKSSDKAFFFLPNAKDEFKIKVNIHEYNKAIQNSRLINDAMIRIILDSIPIIQLDVPIPIGVAIPKPRRVIPPRVALTPYETDAINILFGLRAARGARVGGGQRSFFIKNLDKPGFLTYYLTTYVPEVLLIGISYIKPYNPGFYEASSKLLNVRDMIHISNLFGSTYDGTIEYTVSDDASVNKLVEECDTFSKAICLVSSRALKHIEDHPELRVANIFNVATDDIIEFCHLFTDIPFPSFDSFIEINGYQLHIASIIHYQKLYDLDMRLTTLNRRYIKNPVQILLNRQKDKEAQASMAAGPSAAIPSAAIPSAAIPSAAGPLLARPRSKLRNLTKKRSRVKIVGMNNRNESPNNRNNQSVKRARGSYVFGTPEKK